MNTKTNLLRITRPDNSVHDLPLNRNNLDFYIRHNSMVPDTHKVKISEINPEWQEVKIYHQGSSVGVLQEKAKELDTLRARVAELEKKK